METMSEKVGMMGGNNGRAFDDGVFDGVKKIIVGKDFNCVTYFKIEYGKDGIFETREHGTIRGEVQEFTVDYPNEYITAVGGSYEHVFYYRSLMIKSLIFKTSYGRTSPILGLTTLLGNPSGREFMLEGKNGGKLLGFHGRSGQALDAIGPHFFAVNSPLKQFKPQGGNGGNAWDDGAFDGVRKVLVGGNGKFVSYVRFEYANGERMVPHAHGKRQGIPQEFVVDYPNEHITLVEGTIDGYISSLKFKTSKGRTSPAFGNVVGTKFVLEEKGFKLVGFCGRSGEAIDALGAQFAPLPAPAPSSSLTPPNKGNQNSVSKIFISAGNGGIEQIKFYNVENGDTKDGFFHDVKGKNIISTFVIRNPPNEYLVSVESWYDSSNVFRGIKFETDKTSSDFFGYKFSEDDGTPFSLQVKDKKIIGVHKFADSNLSSPGTYFVLIRSSSHYKLEAQGGNGGETFDNGAFDHVRKVYVGQGDSGVAYIKFEYEKDGKIETHEHGKKTLLGTEEFEVDQDDYITSVKVYYEKLFGLETEIITALIFKTLKGITSRPFGITSGDMFLLEGGKITGFHGSSSNVLHSIGAYVSHSVSPTMLLGKWIQVEQKGKRPGPRCSHAIAMVGDKMYSFGGELTPNFHIDRHLHVFDFKTHTWSLAPPNGDVPELPCLGVCMVAIGTTLYVFGGRDGHRNYNGFYSYDTVKSEWKLITHVSKGPAPRSFHSMASDDKNVYVFGGVSTTVRVNTLHAYNIVDQKWTELPNPGESCKRRGGSGLAVVQGKIWVVYGFSGDEMDDVHCFDPVERKWSKVETSGEKPWARSVFAIAVLGKYIIISGGEIEMDPKAHLGPGKLTGGAFVLDTESLVWEKLEEGHSPRGWCASTTASINGKKGLLMYGGKSPTNGRYDDIFFYGVDSA